MTKYLLLGIGCVVLGVGFWFGNEFNFQTMCDCVHISESFNYQFLSPLAWTDNSSCVRCGHTSFLQLIIDWLYLLPGVGIILATLIFVKKDS